MVTYRVGVQRAINVSAVVTVVIKYNIFLWYEQVNLKKGIFCEDHFYTMTDGDFSQLEFHTKGFITLADSDNESRFCNVIHSPC